MKAIEALPVWVGNTKEFEEQNIRLNQKRDVEACEYLNSHPQVVTDGCNDRSCVKENVALTHFDEEFVQEDPKELIYAQEKVKEDVGLGAGLEAMEKKLEKDGTYSSREQGEADWQLACETNLQNFHYTIFEHKWARIQGLGSNYKRSGLEFYSIMIFGLQLEQHVLYGPLFEQRMIWDPGIIFEFECPLRSNPEHFGYYRPRDGIPFRHVENWISSLVVVKYIKNPIIPLYKVSLTSLPTKSRPRKALLTSMWKTMKFMYVAKARNILMASNLATGVKYENVGMLRREKAINSFDGKDLAFQCMIRFRKSVAYFDPFLPINIITRKAYNTIMTEGLESTGKNLVAIVRNFYVFVGSFTYITDFVVLEDIGEFIQINKAEVVTGFYAVLSSDLTNKIAYRKFLIKNGEEIFTDVGDGVRIYPDGVASPAM
ncbi:hypothetical protein Tco_0490150 [Tanacetum coccineum]